MPTRIQTRARELRREQTPAELAMWVLLRERRLEGVKFRRQYPIGIFIADFCCRERKLIIELDGSVHDADPQQAWDENRDIYLQQRGFKVLRIRNDAVHDNPKAVLQEIFQALRS